MYHKSKLLLTLLCTSLLTACIDNQAEQDATSSEQSYAQSLDPYKTRPITDDVMYFVLPDRFDNGDKSNDKGGIKGIVNIGGSRHTLHIQIVVYHGDFYVFIHHLTILSSRNNP